MEQTIKYNEIKENSILSKKQILEKIKNSPDPYIDRPYKNMDEIVEMIKDIRREDRLKKENNINNGK